VLYATTKISERPQVTDTHLHSFRGKYMPESRWQAGKDASVKGKLRELLILGSTGGGEGLECLALGLHNDVWYIHVYLRKELT